MFHFLSFLHSMGWQKHLVQPGEEAVWIHM